MADGESPQRGSDRMNVHLDDEMKKELRGRLQSGHPTHAEQWKDPEPDADDDPQLAEWAVPRDTGPDREETEAEALRSDLARHLGRTPFPADRGTLMRTLRDAHAPDALLDTLRELPRGGHYRNVQEVVVALGRAPRS
ncbi:DUF2795 domain-containing protein [Streptomyces armeniacus]|uniref:DUF2795 domain-containing protein n=1 Tax=Streptomyces armeniacus TaxID=83291 RepID=A0A345XID4_9ACTN|nr:DUF2795 domain-containing protein [Streptomyces armeniacus]AXK31400.1 DUF2795 domain-containing protein [Streptomyces armeniacus]